MAVGPYNENRQLIRADNTFAALGLDTTQAYAVVRNPRAGDVTLIGYEATEAAAIATQQANIDGTGVPTILINPEVVT